MKILHLTTIRRVLNEAAQKRLDEFDDYDEDEEPVDEHGRNAQWYEDVGMRVPQDLIDKKKEFLEFDLDEDYDEYKVSVNINLDDFSMMIDNFDYGSVVYLKSGTNLEVIEETDDIYNQIKSLNKTIWEKIKSIYKNE